MRLLRSYFKLRGAVQLYISYLYDRGGIYVERERKTEMEGGRRGRERRRERERVRERKRGGGECVIYQRFLVSNKRSDIVYIRVHEEVEVEINPTVMENGILNFKTIPTCDLICVHMLALILNSLSS